MIRLPHLPEVEAEVEHAVGHYEAERPGLGLEFLSALQLGFDAVAATPGRWPVLQGEFRRYRLDRFPYAIVYAVRRSVPLVVAVMHLSRRPGYWRDRLP